jgi:phosphate transport system permease protein
VLALFMIARVIGGRGAGQLSDSQRRRALRRSQDDLIRIVTTSEFRTSPKRPETPAPTTPQEHS